MKKEIRQRLQQEIDDLIVGWINLRVSDHRKIIPVAEVHDLRKSRKLLALSPWRRRGLAAFYEDTCQAFSNAQAIGLLNAMCCEDEGEFASAMFDRLQQSRDWLAEALEERCDDWVAFP